MISDHFIALGLVQFNYNPFVLTLIGISSGNIETMVGIGQDLKEICHLLEQEIFC
jgi:hypothetical protein